jgi:hypothetical protein
VLLPDDFGECLRTIFAGENSITHAETLSLPSRVIQHDLKSRWRMGTGNLKSPARISAAFQKTKWEKPCDFSHLGC